MGEGEGGQGQRRRVTGERQMGREREIDGYREAGIGTETDKQRQRERERKRESQTESRSEEVAEGSGGEEEGVIVTGRSSEGGIEWEWIIDRDKKESWRERDLKLVDQDQRVAASMTRDESSQGVIGMKFASLADGSHRVTEVEAGGAAWSSGVIRAGDRILMVNGMRTSFVERKRVLEAFQGRAGSFVTLEMQREHDTFHVLLQRAARGDGLTGRLACDASWQLETTGSAASR
eukprot:766933-Hanusia_phi.AAC.11